MANCWILNVNNGEAIQNDNQLSFIGGHPRLPKNVNIPSCSLCGQQQSFMLQVAFPDEDEHEWSGFSLAIFTCTSCANEEHLIPEMLQMPLHNVNIPKEFLKNYQKNFRFLVFNTNEGILREDYIDKVIYKPIDLQLNNDPNTNTNKIGGIANWILEDESPSKYDGSSEMYFLMQIEQDYEFEIADNAPRQMELDLSGSPALSEDSFYQLFNSNFIYLFGVKDRAMPLVYAITQT